MTYIFISYNQQNSDFARVLKTEIIEAGFETWMDETRVRPGANWSEEIDRGIRGAIAMAVVMSPEAKASEYVTYEWSFAVGAGVPIIPIMYKQTNLHPKLSNYHHLDFTNHSVRPWGELVDQLEHLRQLRNDTQKLLQYQKDLLNYPRAPAIDGFIPHSFIQEVADELTEINFDT